jgi:hypothetical protein
MSRAIKWFSVCMTAMGFALPTYANADNVTVSCSVAVDYSLDGTTLVENYNKDFVVDAGGFVDDFSTPTRTKIFTASVARQAGDVVVTIDYFNDVGIFHTIELHTSLTIHGEAVASTSGISQFVMATELPLGGDHATNWTLTCGRP